MSKILELAEQFIRPSNLWRLALCEGSAQVSAAVEALLGPPPEADEAALGTSIHDVVAKGMLAWRDGGFTWGEAIDLAVADAANRDLDTWSQRTVRQTLIFYKSLIAKYEIEQENVLIEEDLDMSATGMRRKGRCDLLLVIPHKLVVVVDLKAGFQDQGDADDHDQIAVYGTAAALSFMAPRVDVVLWQPRNDRDRRVSIATFDADTLRNAAAWARAVTNLARADNPPITPHYLQCATCPALRRCPAAKDFVMKTMDALELIGDPVTPEEWADLIGATKLAAKWSEAVAPGCKAYLAAGGKAPGFKLGKPRNLRFIGNVTEALRILHAQWTDEDLAGAITVRVTELEEPQLDAVKHLVGTKPSAAPIIPDKVTV
jgi:hypothetical protein